MGLRMGRVEMGKWEAWLEKERGKVHLYILDQCLVG